MRIVLVLALVLAHGAADAASYSVDGAWLRGPDGAQLLSLQPTFDVDYLAGGRRTRRQLRFAPWRRISRAARWQLVTSARVDDVHAVLTLRGSLRSPAIDVELRVSYGRARRVGYERLSFASGALDRALMLDRALRRRPLGRKPSVVGNLTPQRVWLARGTARVALVGGRGVQSLRASFASGRARLWLELDHQRNHPRTRFRCKLRLPPRYTAPGRDDMDVRRAGEVRWMRARLIVGSARLLEPMRYPRGYRAALVLTDHADQSRATTFEALAFGRTGAVAAGELGAKHAGLVNRGLGYTKTVFVERRGPYAKQLDSPRYRALLAKVGRRVEIGLHSVTGRADDTARVEALLKRFRALGYKGRTWIDHQPDTNCEAVATAGWNRRGRFYCLAALAKHGFRYLWGTIDHILPRASLNILHPDAPGRRRPVLWQHGLVRVDGAPPFWLFASTNIYWRRARVLARTTPRAIDALVRERGLLVAHVYLDTHRTRGRLRNLHLVDRLARGRYRLGPRVDALFARLARRQARGDVLVAGVERVLGHLAAMQALALRHEAKALRLDGRALSQPLSALTLRLPHGAAGARLEGQTRALPSRLHGGRREIWLDVPKGRVLRLQVLDAKGQPLALLPPGGIALR
ncbi:MAG: hypothetical protein KC503_25375 [Myxococcales bacterium]|nr:hypothetical protein [Myxococcales bacterium]